jgi:hypothetical protein
VQTLASQPRRQGYARADQNQQDWQHRQICADERGHAERDREHTENETEGLHGAVVQKTAVWIPSKLILVTDPSSSSTGYVTG